MSTAKTIAERFITYLKEEEQIEHLEEIAGYIQAEALRRQEIHVISALELDAKERKSLEKTLHEKWGEHPTIFTCDPIILSGVIIKYSDTIIDLSGRASLTDLATHLK